MGRQSSYLESKAAQTVRFDVRRLAEALLGSTLSKRKQSLLKKNPMIFATPTPFIACWSDSRMDIKRRESNRAAPNLPIRPPCR